MSTSKRASLRAGVLGLIVGCVPAVWLIGWVAAAPPNAAHPVQPADRPPPLPIANPSLQQFGGLQIGQQLGLQLGQFGQNFGQFGQQFGPPVISPADQELRMRFPFDSLADRLDYEKAALKRLAEEGPANLMTKTTWTHLSALEDNFGSKSHNERTQRLMRLHTDQVRQFVASPGFGNDRMGGRFLYVQAGPTGFKPEDLELPDVAAIPFASVRAAAVGDDRQGAAPTPKPARLAALHTSGLLDFLDPIGFGFARDREHVAGFEPHQFRHVPELPPAPGAAARVEKWAVVRLELVSLLKHERPAVYASDVLPSMADANRPETRPLTSFEEKALAALREGDDLATESSGDRIRMVGSLRAAKQCLDCHGVKRGDLLGAFSWELQRQAVDDERVP